MERFLFLACNQLGAAGSTRQKPRGLRWETHSEGRGEPNTNQNKKAQQQEQQQKTPNFPAAAKREREPCSGSSWDPQPWDELGIFPEIPRAFHWKNMAPLLFNGKKGKEKKRDWNNLFVFIFAREARYAKNVGAAESRLTSKSDPRKRHLGVSVADREEHSHTGGMLSVICLGRNFLDVFNFFSF